MGIKGALLHQDCNSARQLVFHDVPVQRQQPASFIHGFAQDLAVGYAVAGKPGIESSHAQKARRLLGDQGRLMGRNAIVFQWIGLFAGRLCISPSFRLSPESRIRKHQADQQ